MQTYLKKGESNHRYLKIPCHDSEIQSAPKWLQKSPLTTPACPVSPHLNRALPTPEPDLQTCSLCFDRYVQMEGLSADRCRLFPKVKCLTEVWGNSGLTDAGIGSDWELGGSHRNQQNGSFLTGLHLSPSSDLIPNYPCLDLGPRWCLVCQYFTSKSGCHQDKDGSGGGGRDPEIWELNLRRERWEHPLPISFSPPLSSPHFPESSILELKAEVQWRWDYHRWDLPTVGSLFSRCPA